jgi:hypothetical protein
LKTLLQILGHLPLIAISLPPSFDNPGRPQSQHKIDSWTILAFFLVGYFDKPPVLVLKRAAGSPVTRGDSEVFEANHSWSSSTLRNHDEDRLGRLHPVTETLRLRMTR